MSRRIAVIGAGISGLTAAWLLGRRHAVTLFEAAPVLGGHTCTVPVSRDHGEYRIDVGFIVFNNRTYPHFNTLLSQIGVGRQAASMGFAVSCPHTGVEYSGAGLKGVFAQRRNLVSPAHWRMLRDILRFNREAPALLHDEAGELPLGEYLRRAGYGERFMTHYILPMGGAIWSCSEQTMADFPAKFFIRFFENHGLLSLRNRPQWYVVPGGSARYLDALVPQIRADIRTDSPVLAVRRETQGIIVSTAACGNEHFDEVVLACHSDQALALLQDADADEQQCLADIPYQENDVVLHTDTRLLPRRRAVWSSWNALLPEGGTRPDGAPIQVTYNMNILQGIQAPETFCVTLNATDRIAPDKVISRHRFFHPVFTTRGLASRQKIGEINGRRHTWFCGAWCRNGFHEDGVVSALRVAEAFGEKL
ncbi:amine-oxidase [Isoalcanivorax pacificus W11-5]|uniref:Amine-oxidase n=1 Tax=Isoalcanivorax pacificus W11-5 TaxID=391936 RepID=A0A0B4XKQ8_9GAMM|nr:FAD-dependent oxidoreductase [Isoalcanivorax pacificus]AJD47691.1 amine-oxidase [Isoalcanivorax pacificus W11-5]